MDEGGKEVAQVGVFGVGWHLEDGGGDEVVFGFGHGDGGAAVDEGGVGGGRGGDEGGVGEEGGEYEGGVLGEVYEFAGFGVGHDFGGVGGVGVGERGHEVDEFLLLVGGIGGTHGIDELSGLGFVRDLSVNEFFPLSSILKGWSVILELSILVVGGVGHVDHDITRITTAPMTSKTSS